MTELSISTSNKLLSSTHIIKSKFQCQG
uniref:Uncharacterized protein n=1 Tax=Arundo donax TaxID=35708 RepID=A0A0A8Z2T0_ARUDO